MGISNKANARKLQNEAKKRYMKAHPERVILTRAKKRCKGSGLEFSITEQDIIIPKECPILLIPLIPPASGLGTQPGSMTLDRIDNSRGYIPGNIAVISHRANVIKYNLTLNQIKRLYKYVKNGNI